MSNKKNMSKIVVSTNTLLKNSIKFRLNIGELKNIKLIYTFQFYCIKALRTIQKRKNYYKQSFIKIYYILLKLLVKTKIIPLALQFNNK